MVFVEFKGLICDNKSMKDSINHLRDKANMAASERYQQAMVDADIEGAPRSPEIEAMIAE